MTPGSLAYLMHERCACGATFRLKHAGHKHCSAACRDHYKRSADRKRQRQRREQLVLRFDRPTPKRQLPTHCPCGARYTLAVDLWPSERCPSCQPLTLGERIAETKRVNARTRARGAAGARARQTLATRWAA